MAKENQKQLLCYAFFAGIGFLIAKLTGKSDSVLLEMAPARISSGERVVVDSYRVLGAPRPGMSYLPAIGSEGQRIEFEATRSGIFTRNVVRHEGKIFAEIKYES